MNAKGTLGLGLVIGAGAGLALGAALFRSETSPPPAPTLSSPDSLGEKVLAAGQGSPVATELAQARAESQRLLAQRDELVAKREELEARLARAEEQLATAQAAAEPEEEPEAPSGSELAIDFGPHAELKPLREADWAKLGASSTAIAQMVDDILEQLASGQGVDASTRLKLATENQNLVGFAMAISGELPTHAPGNGEYTHPLVMANLISESLEQQGEPLGRGQQDELSRLGEEYEREWERIQASYDERTLALTKVLDELELKQTFTDRLRATLSPAQRAVLGPEGARDKIQLDLFSPALMLIAVSAPVAATRAELPATIQKQAAATWGLEGDVLVGFEPVFAAWLARLSERLVEVSGADIGLFTSVEALHAGRAQLEAMQELLRALPLDDAVRQRMREARVILVPRLVAGE